MRHLCFSPGIALLLATGVFAADEIYIKLGGLNGAATDAGHIGWSICDSVTFNGAPPLYQPASFAIWLVLTKETDGATPPVQEMTAAHTKLDSVLLDIKRTADSADYYYRVAMSNVSIISAGVISNIETLLLVPEFVQWTYVEAGTLLKTDTYATPPDGRSGFVTSNVDGDAEADMADADDDNDGSSDQEEFWAGTDATDPDSFFRIQMVQTSATNGMLTWQSAAGRQYHIYRSFHPTGTYQRITASPVPAAAGTTTQEEVPLGGNTPLFYVVSEWP